MLRHRQSMKSKPALSHRKSTSSARSVVLEHLDPAVAQRDAQTAAHQAFTRAQDRCGADMALFPPPPSPSHLRHIHSADESTPSGTSHLADEPSISRRQSVRFVGPCTVAKGARQRPQTPASVAHSAIDPASVIEPPTRPGTSASVCPSKVFANHLHALNAEDNVYTPEDDIASMPSSYRRLRRSQTLHPARGARSSGESYLLPAVVPGREVRTSMSMRTLNSSQAKENIRPQKGMTLRAPKSMSFLKGRRGRVSSVASHDTVSNTPMDADPTQLFTQPPLRNKTSSFFGSRTRRAERLESGLRKTLRNSSSQSELVPSSADTGLPLPKGPRGSLRIKARKASKTLRNKLKNFFSSTRDDDEALFPDQHVRSQKTHGDRELVSLGTSSGEHNQDEDGNEPPLQHYSHDNMSEVFPAPHSSTACSRKAGLQAFAEQPWGQGSNDDKALDDKSRVTSWTNSGPSTLTSEQQAAWKEWEKQRLSIIKENGAHCPSPSLRRQAIGKHIVQSQESLIGQPLPPGPTVDSQRVYAALMERLAETTQLAQAVEQQRKSLVQNPSIPVQPACSPDFEDYEDSDAKPAPLIVRRTTSNDSLIARVRDAKSPDEVPRLSPPIALTPWNDSRDAVDGHGIASAEKTNAFFGSTEAHLFRTISPYRRALRKSMEEAEDVMHGRTSGDRIISAYGTEIQRPDEACYEDAYSESVYSSDEPPPGAATNVMHSLTQMVQAPPNRAGIMSTAGIPLVTSQHAEHRVLSSVSSIDWKTWLSANVARLEPSPSPPRPSAVGNAHSNAVGSYEQGHFREAAQISDEEEHGELHQSAPESHQSRLLAPGLTPMASDMVKTPASQKSIFRRTRKAPGFPIEIDSQKTRQESCNQSLPSPELPPPIPARSPLRKNPCLALASPKPVDELPNQLHTAEEGHNPGHKPSVDRLRGGNKIAESPWTPTPKPTKLQKKRSGFLYTPSIGKSAATSPGLTTAVEKQFGPAMRTPVQSDENKENEAIDDAYGTRESDVLVSGGSVDGERSAKARRMVNVFLSSRRKRMASGSDDGPAFL